MEPVNGDGCLEQVRAIRICQFSLVDLDCIGQFIEKTIPSATGDALGGIGESLIAGLGCADDIPIGGCVMLGLG